MKKLSNPSLEKFVFFLPSNLVNIYKVPKNNNPSTLNIQLNSVVILSKADRDYLNLYDVSNRCKNLPFHNNFFDEIEILEEESKTNNKTSCI